MSYTDPFWLGVIVALFAGFAFACLILHFWEHRPGRKRQYIKSPTRSSDSGRSATPQRVPTRTWHDGEWVDNARS